MLLITNFWKTPSLLRVSLAIALLLSCSLVAWADSQQKPNFVIIILDDWGSYDSGAYGNTHIQTPNIDSLASKGAQFNNAFLTAATCSSSRASILTGLHPFAAGVPKLHVPIPADRKLLSSYLHKAGYFTASVGKWHIGEQIISQFDLVINERTTMDESQTGEEDWLSTIETKLPVNRPFFLWLAARDPHRPWLNDPKWAVHNPDSIAIPPYIEINATHSPDFVKHELSMYYDEIHRADFHIGEVVKALEKKKLLDNTVIILMSDNGSPFWKAKKFLTDPGLKTPFIVYWPKQIKEHKNINELMSAVDIAPTLLDLAGITKPEQMEGTSFASWLTAPASDKPIREFVYGERGDGLLGSENGRSIRDKQYLYIIDDYKTYTECSDPSKLDFLRGEYLYDVVNDPNNLNNLATKYNWAEKFWRRIKGEKDYTATLEHYRELMTERRKQRHDSPEPVIKGVCPPAWWHETPEDSTSTDPASKNNLQTMHD